jgi:hypothetical protein
MRRAIQRATFWAGLTMFVTGVTGGREAQAIIGIPTGNSLTITGSAGTVSGTDPIFFYTFDVTFSGYQWNSGDYLTFGGLNGLSSTSIAQGYTVIVSGDSVSLGPLQPSGFNYPMFVGGDTSELEWKVAPGGSPPPGPTTYEFRVYTDDETDPSFAPSTSLNYQVQVTDATAVTTALSGTFSVTAIGVPEPSTLIFLVSAAAVTPLAILGKRRCRPAPQAV